MNQKLSGAGGQVQCRAGIWGRSPAPGSFLATLPMLPRRLPCLLSAMVLAVGPGPAPPHTWIVDLKANRSRFAAVGVVLVAVVLVRVARQERRNLVAPPLWLLPLTGPSEPASGGAQPPRPPLRYEPEVEEAEFRERERLRQRKQHLAFALVTAVAVTVTSGTWAARNFPWSPDVPRSEERRV